MSVNKIFIPTLISSVTYEPVRTLPHIYFYNGLKESEPYFIQHYPSGSSTSSVVVSEQNSFPYVDYYDGLIPSTGSNSLLFFNEQAVYGETPTASLYSEYWDTYVSLLYNPRTRLFKASAIIPLADYFEMELNDIVQWRGNYYHLRAINDYNLKDGTCKIELLGPIIRDAVGGVEPPTPEIDCTFDFSSSFEGGVTTTTTTSTTTTTAGPTTTTTTTTAGPTTTTTAGPTTTTTAGPTTTTTTAAQTPFSASGGTVGTFTSGGIEYVYHQFTSSAQTTTSNYTLTSITGSTTKAIIYVIGGGGAGGVSDESGVGSGGGGGAGQLVISGSFSLSFPTNYSIQVGRGGIGVTSQGNGDNGIQSSFGSITATAGLGGVGGTSTDLDGGNSGNGFLGGDGGSAIGGGGAGAAANGTSANIPIAKGGNGGTGILFDIGFNSALGSGTTPEVCGGGGGGTTSTTRTDRGSGGYGGGAGAYRTSGVAEDGDRFCGGGGGGGRISTSTGRGTNGGDGIVIVVDPKI